MKNKKTTWTKKYEYQMLDPQFEIRILWANVSEGMDRDQIAEFIRPDVFKAVQS